MNCVSKEFVHIAVELESVFQQTAWDAAKGTIQEKWTTPSLPTVYFHQ